MLQVTPSGRSSTPMGRAPRSQRPSRVVNALLKAAKRVLGLAPLLEAMSERTALNAATLERLGVGVWATVAAFSVGIAARWAAVILSFSRPQCSIASLPA